MARHVREKPPSQNSWLRENGIAGLVIALGVTMTVPINVYIGAVLVALGTMWLGFDFGQRVFMIGDNAKWAAPAYASTALLYASFLWFVLVPAPLTFVLISPRGNYKAGDVILGIPWKATYHPVRFLIGNETAVDYSHFDLYIRTSTPSMAWPGFSSELNQCQISIDMPNLMARGATLSSKDAGGNMISTPLFDEDKQRIVATIFRIRCEKVASKSWIEMLLPVLGLEEPSWISIDASYEAANRGHHTFDSRCTLSEVSNCFYVHLPEALE